MCVRIYLSHSFDCFGALIVKELAVDFISFVQFSYLYESLDLALCFWSQFALHTYSSTRNAMRLNFEKKNYKNYIYWNAHAHSATHTLTRSFGVPYSFCLLNSLRRYFFQCILMQFSLPEFVWNVRNIIWLYTHYIAQCT